MLLSLGIRELGVEGSEGIDDIDNEDIGNEDDDIHQQTYLQEVAKPVSAGTIDQHVCGRADRRSETAADGYHKRYEEREGLVA